MYDDCWLDMAEVSETSIAALRLDPGDALFLSKLVNNQDDISDCKTTLSSTVVEAYAVPDIVGNDDKSVDVLIRLHPLLFHFLYQVVELISNDNTTRQNSGDVATPKKLLEEEKENYHSVTIAPLPMDPIVYSETSKDDDNITSPIDTPICSDWMICRQEVVTDSKHPIKVFGMCIYADPPVHERIFKNGDEESNKTVNDEAQIFFNLAFEGRIVKVGSVVLVCASCGYAIIQISNIEADDESAEFDPNLAYRLSSSYSTFSVHVSPSVDTTNENKVEEDDQSSGPIAFIDHCETNIPGYEPLLEQLIKIVNLNATFAAAPSAILLCGCSGVGKSRLSYCLLNHYRVKKKTVAYISVEDLIFRSVTEHDPFGTYLSPRLAGCTIVVIDDLHMLEVDDDDDDYDFIKKGFEYKIAQNCIMQVFEEYGTSGRCKIVGICRNMSRLSPGLTKIGRFEKKFDIPVPTQYQRERIWNYLLTRHVVDAATRRQWSSAMARATSGCVAADLVETLQSALATCSYRSFGAKDGAVLQWEHLHLALQACVPSQLSELDVLKPTVFGADLTWEEKHAASWSKFAGYASVKRLVFRQVVLPWRQFLKVIDDDSDGTDGDNLTLEPPPGIIFHGPSGCGKTRSVEYLASSLELPMIRVRATDVLDKWLGGSEALIRSLFARARSASPCILFLDDIDSIANNRAEDDSNDFTSRILSTLLNELDGVSSAVRTSRVLVAACTNRLQALDTALLRPGRLQEHFHLDIPSEQDLVEALTLYTHRMPLHEDVKFENIAGSLVKMDATGADVEGMCRDACFVALREMNDLDNIFITNNHFQVALGNMRS